MKHTIKTGLRSGVTVTDQWLLKDEIFLSLFNGTDYQGMPLTEDQAGAVIFALEQALETRKIARDRELRCAGDGLCSVPAVACATPSACGVAA